MESPVRILHFDDNPFDGQLVSREITRRGMPAQLSCVSSMADFKNALAKKDFDIVLTDCGMSSVDGGKVLSMVRTACPDIPLIMVTGEVGEERAIETLKQGATDYVLKSNLQRLVPAIERALQEGEQSRKKVEVEEQLRKSERLYRAVGETINYGIWVCNTDGKNTYASPSFLNLVGMTQEECSEFGWGRVLHPDESSSTIDAWKEIVRSGSQWERVHRFMGVDGKYHHVLARGIPVRDEKGNIICWAGINLDIEDLKDAESRLRSSEQMLKEIIRSSPSFVCLLRGPNHVFELANEEYLKLVGRRDIIGKPNREALPDGERQGFVTLLDQVYKSGHPFVGREMKAKVGGGDGQPPTENYIDMVILPMKEMDGSVSGLYVHGNDVTEQVHARQIIEQNEARLNMVMEYADVAAWQCDSQFRYTWVYRPRLRIRAEDCIGKTAVEVVDEDSGGQVFSLQKEAISKGASARRVIRYMFNGVERFLDSRADPLRDSHGTIIGAMGVSLEVTERMQTEQRLKKSEEYMRAMVKKSNDPMVLIDETGIIECISEIAAQQLGYELEDIVGIHVEKLLDWGTKLDLMFRYQDFLRHLPEPSKSSLRIKRKNGTWCWMNLSASVMNFGQKPHKYLLKSDSIEPERFIGNPQGSPPRIP